jgi:hypothetical protein
MAKKKKLRFLLNKAPRRIERKQLNHALLGLYGGRNNRESR